MALQNANALPLATRQAARTRVHDEMAKRPQQYAANLRGLYDNNPEARAYIQRNILNQRKNTNVIARAGQFVASEVYGCPSGWAAASWHKLLPLEKRIIDDAFQREIDLLTIAAK